MKVRKAIIPAAGRGTRFLPATKAQPKEMLPIVDKPTIQYIVEEAVASGIEEIIIIIGRGKWSIVDHFDKYFELDDTQLKKDQLDSLTDIQQITNLVKIYYALQAEPKGLGHAVLCAKSFIGDEPFAVLLSDDVVMPETPCIQQLMKVYEDCKSSVVGVQSVSEHEVSKYGIVKSKETVKGSNIIPIDYLVEKPSEKTAPSQTAIMGRYILTPEIFGILERLPVGYGSEMQLTDAINELNKQQQIIGFRFEGRHYDLGDKLGFIQANIDYALKRNDLQEDVVDFLLGKLNLNGKPDLT